METLKNFKLYVTEETQAHRHLLSAAGIDVLNSLCWLLMDAFWMFGLPKIGIFFGLPTLLTGFILFKRERGPSGCWNHLATHCWILMNMLWMVSDTYHDYEAVSLKAAKLFLMMGMFFVVRGMQKTGNLSEAIAHYKRYKELGRKKVRVIRS
ncbi:MAG: hypothetical protein H7333_07795 [Bdellovibrionales bacterium]|nr:hypothetical protein [Oligoflexia bacterium]